MDTEFDPTKPDIEDFLIALELPIHGLHNQLENLLYNIQDNRLIVDSDCYNIVCGQLTLSIAGIEYIKKICQQQYKELDEYFEKKNVHS